MKSALNLFVRSFTLSMVALMALSTMATADEAESLLIQTPSRALFCVSYSPDGASIAAGGPDGAVFFWEAASGKQIRRIDAHESDIFAVAFSADGSSLASSSFDGTVKVWDVASGKLIRQHVFDSYSTAIDISHKGLLAIGLQNGSVEIFNITSGETVRTLNPKWPVYSLAFSKDGSLLATGGPIQIWNTESWEPGEWLRAPGGVFDLDFAPDRTVLASAHLRGTAYIWSEATFEKVHEFTSPISFRGLGPGGTEPMEAPMPLTSVAFSPDGKSVATGGADKTVRVWSTESGEIKHELEGHEMSIVGLSFSPDGKSLASASLDGTIRIWKLR